MLVGPAGLVRAATPGVDGRIAYVGYAPVPGEPDAGYEAIFTANPDGSARKLVPHSGTPETTSSHPVWSPDSTRLAFVSEHSDPDTGETIDTINVINADGSGRTALADGIDPAWTPDGQWISYTVAGPLSDWDTTYKVPVAGGDPEVVIDGADVRWSPDGSKFAFRRGWPPDLFIRDVATGEETAITPDSPDTYDWVGDWAPDSHALVFSSEGDWPDPGASYIVNSDGSDMHELLTPARDLAWSPSGQHLIYWYDNGDYEALALARPDGSIERTTDIQGRDPAWGSAPLVPPADARPNTCAKATTATSKGPWHKEAINSATDQDWFRFSLASKGRVQVTLGALPEDYRLELYSTCSTLLASSNRSGRQFEEIVKSLPAGTYRVRVRGSLSSGTPYQLRFRVLASGLPILSFRPNIGGSEQVGEVLNNTTANRTGIVVTVRSYNKFGTLLKTTRKSLGGYIAKPGGRLPFRVISATPTGTTRVTAAVTSSSPTSATPATLTVVASAPWVCTLELCPQNYDDEGNLINDDPSLHYEGTVRNGHTYSVTSAKVAATFYDSRGYVRDAYYVTPSGSGSIAPGATENWAVVAWDKPNRAAFVGVGVR